MNTSMTLRRRRSSPRILCRGAAVVLLQPTMKPKLQPTMKPELADEPVNSDREYPWGLDVDGLVAEHMDFARELAREWEGRGVDPDDLESEATVALWRAAREYRPGPKTFKSWAQARITRDLINLVVDQRWPGGIEVPRDLRRIKRKLYRATAELLAEGINRPTPEEVCERSGIDLESAREALGLPTVGRLDEDR
jgi:RNA polymerase sigma factor (sigma-70 family)